MKKWLIAVLSGVFIISTLTIASAAAFTADPNTADNGDQVMLKDKDYEDVMGTNHDQIPDQDRVHDKDLKTDEEAVILSIAATDECTDTVPVQVQAEVRTRLQEMIKDPESCLCDQCRIRLQQWLENPESCTPEQCILCDQCCARVRQMLQDPEFCLNEQYRLQLRYQNGKSNTGDDTVLASSLDATETGDKVMLRERDRDYIDDPNGGQLLERERAHDKDLKEDESEVPATDTADEVEASATDTTDEAECVDMLPVQTQALIQTRLQERIQDPESCLCDQCRIRLQQWLNDPDSCPCGKCILCEQCCSRIRQILQDPECSLSEQYRLKLQQWLNNPESCPCQNQNRGEGIGQAQNTKQNGQKKGQ